MFKNDRRIVPAESKCITQNSPDFALLRLVEGEIQPVVQFRVVRKVIDRRRNEMMPNRQNTSDRFHRTRCAQQVAGHGFGGANVQLVGMFPILFEWLWFQQYRQAG